MKSHTKNLTENLRLGYPFKNFWQNQSKACAKKINDPDKPSVQFSSVTQLCPIPYDPINCSMPGFPIHHQLLELAQTHVHRVGDAIQPSHPLLSPSV